MRKEDEEFARNVIECYVAEYCPLMGVAQVSLRPSGFSMEWKKTIADLTLRAKLYWERDPQKFIIDMEADFPKLNAEFLELQYQHNRHFMYVKLWSHPVYKRFMAHYHILEALATREELENLCKVLPESLRGADHIQMLRTLIAHFEYAPGGQGAIKAEEDFKDKARNENKT